MGRPRSGTRAGAASHSFPLIVSIIILTVSSVGGFYPTDDGTIAGGFYKALGADMSLKDLFEVGFRSLMSH